jgi:hypothetical protein
MLGYYIDNIFVQFGGLVFRQTIEIPMDTNCALLFAYETNFRQGLFKNKYRKFGQTFNSCIPYIDDVISQKILYAVIICISFI